MADATPARWVRYLMNRNWVMEDSWRRQGVYWLTSPEFDFSVRITDESVLLYSDPYGCNHIGSWKTGMNPSRTSFDNIARRNSHLLFRKEQV